MKKIAFHWQILIGMVIGVVWGLIAVETVFTVTLYHKPTGV